MLVSVYLHKPIVETLRCYGDLDSVVNKILKHCQDGDIDVMDKPKVPNRHTAGRYEVDVTNEEYLQLLAAYGKTSSRISLGRLLYWFVDNELYELLEWQPCETPVDRNTNALKHKLSKALNCLADLYISMPEQNKLQVEHAIKLIGAIKV